ncbi:MAG: hypothetical protein IKI04_01980 [Bacilli bacterium]|nr:hypothetical protein [Bacilli bacterium]
MKKLLITIPLLIIFGALGTYLYSYYVYDPYEVPEEVVINLNENEFQIYEEHKSTELIRDINTEVLSNEVLLNNDKLGTYTYTLDYKYKKKRYKYDITYSVKDMVKPVFISAPVTLTMESSDSKSICEKIVYADDYDNSPKCEIVGNYDKTTVGTYNDLEYVITDSAGNENRKKFSLNIVYKINNSSNYARPNYIYMNEILNNYKNDSTSIGIDVSKWQGNVDFNKVKDAGIEFVIMRIGSQRSPEEEIDMDVRFKEYYKACKELGLKVGVYVYNTAISPEDGIKTAKWVIKELNGDKLDFPIAYDWENWSNFMDYKISLHTLGEAYKAFQKELNDNGYEAMLYSSKYYLVNVWPEFTKDKVWLAHYTSETDYDGEYMMWQMTSSARINGITENTVDIDILYKEKAN